MSKYYHYDKIWNRYRVRKTIDGKRVSFGTYATEEEAKLIVEELKKHDWNREKLMNIRESLNIQSVRDL